MNRSPWPSDSPFYEPQRRMPKTANGEPEREKVTRRIASVLDEIERLREELIDIGKELGV